LLSCRHLEAGIGGQLVYTSLPARARCAAVASENAQKSALARGSSNTGRLTIASMELIAATAGPRSNNLVFTSAGDRSNLRGWLKGRRNFDLWTVYYGEQGGMFQDLSTFYLPRKGSKFQNLHHCYQRWREVLARYDAIMVLDDDIVIDATGITRLFEIRRELDLWALQPAFRLSGKISWDITAVHPTAKLRYTNFIEMTCPLVRRDKLDAFMAIYDPELVGYGADWWFLSTLGPDIANRVAIVDEITCVNPHDRTKGGVREIDRLQSHAERKEVWARIRALHGVHEQGRLQREFRRINKSLLGAAASLLGYVPDWACLNARELARRLVRRGTPG
jgi:hypothetical protein